MFHNSRPSDQSSLNLEDSKLSVASEDDEIAAPSVLGSLKASFSLVLVTLSSFGGGVDTNTNHSCSGCPTCLPPPRVEVMKKKEEQSSEDE